MRTITTGAANIVQVTCPFSRWVSACALTAVIVASAPTLRAQATSRSVGDQVCQGCHAEIAKDFTGNLHFRVPAKATEVGERQACEGCHGPGQTHIFDPEHRSIAIFSELTPSESQTLCLECHAGDFGKMHLRLSVHRRAEVGCIDCHAIHQAHPDGPLLTGRERELCYSCHQSIRARFDMPFKHRVNEGAMECTDCHNPHGAEISSWGGAHGPSMVSTVLGGDQACFRCHVDKRGPFLHEHAPVVSEGCVTCHNPHGSTNARLLNRPVAFTLCMECHSDIAGFGTRGDAIPGPTDWFHNLSDPNFRECVVCHAKIHGSNADSKLRR